MPDPKFFALMPLLPESMPPELWTDDQTADEETAVQPEHLCRLPDSAPSQPRKNWTGIVAIFLLLWSGLALSTHGSRIGASLSHQASGIAIEIGIAPH